MIRYYELYAKVPNKTLTSRTQKPARDYHTMARVGDGWPACVEYKNQGKKCNTLIYPTIKGGKSYDKP